MAQQLREGQTGTAPDGTRVRVINGQIAPVDGAGFADLGGGMFQGPDGAYFQRNRFGDMIARTRPMAPGGSPQTRRTRSLRTAHRERDLFRQEVMRALDILGSGESGLVGDISRRVPGTRAYDLEALLQTIGANIGFRYLTAMREASPTGGALGNVSNFENELLQATSGSLKIGQSEGQLRSNLQRLLYLADASYRDVIEHYEGDFGQLPSDFFDQEDGDSGANDGGAAGDAQPEGPVDISSMSAAELLQLEPGTELLMPDGTVTRLTGRPEVGASGDEVSPGVYARPQTPEQAVEQRRDANPILRRLDAGVRGAADMMSLGFADEIAAGGDALFGRGEGDTFMDRYRSNVAIQRGIDEADQQDVPVSRGVGQVAGAVTGGTAALRGASRLPAALRVQQGQRIRNVARVGAGGAVTAGAAAAGGTEGDLAERGRNALAAAPVGAVAAPIAGQAVNVLAPHVGRAAGFLGDQANRGVRALGRRGWDGLERNALDTGADRLVQRGVNTNALADRAREFRDAGIDPTFADVTDSAGRGTLRALATRQTPARQMAEDFAEGRAEAMPSRLSFQARRTISDDMRSPDQIRGQLTEARSRQADQDYGAVQARVPVDDALLDAIGDEPGRAAIRAARAGAIERRDTATVQELDRLTEEIGLRGQLSGMGVNSARMRREPLELSALTVERLRRAMGERGGRFSRQGRNEQASGAFSRREAVESALDAVPEVAQARGNFRTASQQIEAVGTGEQFLGQNTDEFVARVNAMTPEERRLARAGAARAIEVAGQNTGRAPGVARSLYANPEQARRSAALLGDDAGALQRGMRAESDALEASRQINPRSGSPTNLNQQDTAAAAGEAVGAVRDVATGNIGGLAMRVTRRLQSRGFSDAEADAIVRASIDPSRTDELIAMLSQRMSRREARNLLRSVRFAAAQNAGESTAQ